MECILANSRYKFTRMKGVASTRRLSTVVKEMSVIRTLYRRLIAAGKVKESPIEQIHVALNSHKPRPRNTPTASSVERISATTRIGIRDPAIARLRSIGLSTGQ